MDEKRKSGGTGAHKRTKTGGAKTGEAKTGQWDARPFDPRAQRRSDDAQAFLPDPDERGWGPVSDDLAETLGEGFVAAATTGENVEDEVLDQVVPEEIGGPFIETRDTQEFALGSDDMNPEEAEREPLPRAVSGLVSAPVSEGYTAEGEDGGSEMVGGDHDDDRAEERARADADDHADRLARLDASGDAEPRTLRSR